MFLFMLGMLVCVGIAIVIIALIASPSFREGERFFTSDSEERVQNMRRRAAEDAARGRDVVRSAVARRKSRSEDEEPTDVPAGPEYRVTDVDGFSEDEEPADRHVRMTRPGREQGPGNRRGRLPATQDDRGPASARGDRTGRPETVDLRDRRQGEDPDVDLTTVEDRESEPRRGRSTGPAAAAGVVAAGATAIGSRNRRPARDEADTAPAAEPRTRFDLPAVSRHEEAHEQEDVYSDLIDARPGPSPRQAGSRDRATTGASPISARTRDVRGQEDAVEGAALDEVPARRQEKPPRGQGAPRRGGVAARPVAGSRDGSAARDVAESREDDGPRRTEDARPASKDRPAAAWDEDGHEPDEGGFMTRITGSLSRSGTDRTRTGPRHARG